MKVVFETQVHRIETADPDRGVPTGRLAGGVHCLLKGMSFDSGHSQFVEVKMGSPNPVSMPRFMTPVVVTVEFDEHAQVRADDKPGLMSMYRAMILGLEAMRAVRPLSPKCEAELADIRENVWHQLSPHQQAILEREAE